MSTITAPTFDGATFVANRDHTRLSRQLLSIKAIMLDGEPHTLSELSAKVGCSEASASARLRDLRKTKFGGWDVKRKHINNGLHSYTLGASPMPTLQ